MLTFAPSLALTPHTPIVEVLLRMSMAALFGAIIGWEREWKNKPAGIRTHMLVCLGAALFTLTALELAQGAAELGSQVQVDPMRLIGGMVGGIGFLGAGAIIQARGEVHGMTTAAGLWMSGAIGIASGFGHYFLATLGAGFAILVLTLVYMIEKRLVPQRDESADAADGSLPSDSS